MAKTLESLAIKLTLAAAAACLSGPSALAQAGVSQPVAIVENVDSTPANVEVFEYLEAGRVVHLSPGDSLTLGYLRSCLREIIHGGDVKVGALQSSVQGGQVVRQKVECDGGRADLSAAQASQSGVIAFRRPPQGARGSRKNPITVYSLEPFFVFPETISQLTVRRVDRAEADLLVTVGNRSLDFAEQEISVNAGGIYEARAGAMTRVFEISPGSTSGGPLLGRLVRF
jgi:hypothetical protein